MTVQVTTAWTFEEAAICWLVGCEFEEAQQRERRVALLFRDPEGKGAKAILAHNTIGFELNSRDFTDAVMRAKRIVFATRDER